MLKAVTISFAIVGLTLVGGTGTVQADQGTEMDAADEKWIAAAIDKNTLTVGFARDLASKADAEKQAKDECSEHGANCSAVMAQNGGCLALSRNADRSSLGIGMEKTIQAAVIKALEECQDGGKYSGCTVHTNFCAE